MKKDDFKTRIDAIIKALGFRRRGEFARALGIKDSYLSHLVNGRQTPSERFFENVLTRFPRVSETFLRSGKGNPLNPERITEIDREALISMILRNFNRLEPAAQSVILETARRLAESAADKKNDRSDESDGLDPPAVRAG